MTILLTIAVAVLYLVASGLLLRRLAMGAEARTHSKLPPLLAGLLADCVSHNAFSRVSILLWLRPRSHILKRRLRVPPPA